MATTRAAVASAIAEKSGLTKAQSESALSAFEAVIKESLAQDVAVKIPGFISFEKVQRSARTGRNPRSGEAIEIPAKAGVKISAGSGLKNSVA
ncbi:HU family DNA-binding protein [Micrococcales bacterium 31B]|nr:HU family DNA-binding protein [Micrococcales bacterium 31B]